MIDALCLRPGDDVANALAPVAPGDSLMVLPDRAALTATDTVPRYHKIALRPLTEGTTVRRNGIAIGVATQAIAAGAHVHIHNLRSLRASLKDDKKETT